MMGQLSSSLHFVRTRLFATPLDAAIIHVSLPDEHGFCSRGVEVGLTKSPAESAKIIIAEVNQQMPRTLGDSFIHVSRLNHIIPVNYPIPSDGPVGRMLRATGRHPWRPAHIHFVVSADGYEPVTTHIFDRRDEYLGSDAVFAVKDSLICDFVRHEPPDGEPYYTAEFDFRLKPATEQRATVLDAQQRLAALGARAAE